MKAGLGDNLSYKFVALGIALILWVSMMGRKDATMTKDFELQVLLGPSLELSSPTPQLVRVEIAGPRVALKKVSQMSPVFTIDLSAAKPGNQLVHLNHDGLNLPLGARVVSIEPRDFNVYLREARSSAGSAP